MTSNPPAGTAETLLAHTGWMRRLARTLVRDDAQADDVVQDAVVAALRTPPRDPVALPAWLASTVRNGAKELWRGDGRRAAREKAASRAEAAPGAAEVVARAEEHGLVVQAVLALEEPYRSTLLLRFFDDLPPREIASRLGVPVETVRARVRRGVEQLRARLDGAHGGDGRAWKLALVPLTFHHGPAAAGGAGAGTGAATGHQVTTGALIMAGSGTVAAVGGLALVLGIASGWWLGATKSDAIAGAHLKTIAKVEHESQVATAKLSEYEEHLKRLTAQIAELEMKLRAAQQEAAELRVALDEKSAALAAALAAAPKSTALVAPVRKGPRFAFAEFAKLGDVDWKVVGEHLNAISPLCGEIAVAMAKGEDTTAAQGKAAQHNGFLINAAIKIVGQVPGTGVNGAFTHPAFQANAIASALDAAGKPLTEEQAAALERLTREFCDEDARRLQAYTDTTFGIQKVIDEAELRRRFFEAAFAALSEAQRNALTPPGTQGLIGLDLYSEGLLYATVMRPVPYKDAAGLTDSITNVLQGGMKIPKDQTESLRAVVAAWQRDLPQSMVDPSAGAPAHEGPIHVDAVHFAATKTLSLVKSILTELKLEGPAAAQARRWPTTILPMRGNDE